MQRDDAFSSGTGSVRRRSMRNGLTSSSVSASGNGIQLSFLAVFLGSFSLGFRNSRRFHFANTRQRKSSVQTVARPIRLGGWSKNAAARFRHMPHAKEYPSCKAGPSKRHAGRVGGLTDSWVRRGPSVCFEGGFGVCRLASQKRGVTRAPKACQITKALHPQQKLSGV